MLYILIAGIFLIACYFQSQPNRNLRKADENLAFVLEDLEKSLTELLSNPGSKYGKAYIGETKQVLLTKMKELRSNRRTLQSITESNNVSFALKNNVTLTWRQMMDDEYFLTSHPDFNFSMNEIRVERAKIFRAEVMKCGFDLEALR